MKTLEQLIHDVHKLQKYLPESGVYLELGYGGDNMRLMTTHRVVMEWTGGRSATYKLCGIAWLKGKEEPWQYHGEQYFDISPGDVRALAEKMYATAVNSQNNPYAELTYDHLCSKGLIVKECEFQNLPEFDWRLVVP